MQHFEFKIKNKDEKFKQICLFLLNPVFTIKWQILYFVYYSVNQFSTIVKGYNILMNCFNQMLKCIIIRWRALPEHTIFNRTANHTVFIATYNHVYLILYEKFEIR